MARIALAQLNLTVGNLAGNVERMASAAASASDAGADIVCFPELAVTGYPPEDLVLRPEFVSDGLAALDELARLTASGCDVLVGFVDRSDGGIHNAAALLRGGSVVSRYHKVKLPNYGVFDEKRYFTPGTSGAEVEIGGDAGAPVRAGVSICEDAWGEGAPFDIYAADGVPLVLNINGSPFHRGKIGMREEVLRARAAQTGAWIAYVNMVGGQDELVFDGGSMVMAPDGTVTRRGVLFDEELMLIDLDLASSAPWPAAKSRWPDEPEDVYMALVTGLRDYVRKNGFSEVVVGLSGGIDSALVAVLAADALGPESVHGLAMPSMYSSESSVSDAYEVARRTGIRIDEVPIKGVFDQYEGSLAELLKDDGQGVAHENLQARIRGNLLMAISNRFGGLVLATGNKSEYAVGYSTLYGDMAGGFAPIKDVPKTLVYELARWRNSRDGEPIPPDSITKPPSAELRPDQKDTDNLPPYEKLDPIIEAYVEDDLGVDEIVALGHERSVVKRVVRMIDKAEYKRRQAAPGVKITPKAFGRDRRMPITNRYSG